MAAPTNRPDKASWTRDWGLFLLSFLAAVFYAACATPSLGWRDGPELVSTALYLDVAHPAGFPTYNLLAKIFTWIPLGSLGFRVTLFSAACGGGAVLLLGLLIKKLLALSDPKPSPGTLAWAWSVLPLMALHQGVWAAAVEVEVYTLNLALLAGLFYCAASWYAGSGIRWLYAGGLLYGLACGNHAALALYLPVLLLLAVWGAPPGGPDRTPANGTGRRMGLLVLFFLAGVSVYLLLYVRSNLDYLPINFGYPNNLERFWYHVTDGKDRGFHASGLFKIGQLLFFLGRHFKSLTSGLFWLGLPLSVWGLVHLWRRYQILSVALIVLILVNMVFFFYWIDGVSAFLPTVLAWFLLVSVGLGRLGGLLSRLGLPRAAVTGAAVLICLAGVRLSGPDRWTERETEAGFMAVELFWPDLASLPPEAVYIQYDAWFVASALQSVYRARPDVTLIEWNRLKVPRESPPFSPSVAPTAAFPRTDDGGILPLDDPLFSSRFLETNLEAGHEVLVLYCDDTTRDLGDYLRPDFRFRLLASLQTAPSTKAESLRLGEYDRYLAKMTDFAASLAAGDDPHLARKAPTFLFYSLRPVAGLLEAGGRPEQAEAAISRFIDLFSDPDGEIGITYDSALNTRHFQASVLFKLGRYPEATKALETLVAMDPSIAYAHFLLGLSLDREGQTDRALESLGRAADMEPENTAMAVEYASKLAMRRSISEALGFLGRRTRELRSDGLVNAAHALDDFAECLALPPELQEAPSQGPPTPRVAPSASASGLEAAPSGTGSHSGIEAVPSETVPDPEAAP